MFLFCNLLKIKGQGVVKMPIKVKLRSENDKIHLKICVGDLLIKNAKLLKLCINSSNAECANTVRMPWQFSGANKRLWGVLKLNFLVNNIFVR